MLHLRWGHIEDENRNIVDSPWGAGLGFDLAGFGGFRVDYAKVPQPRTFDSVDRWGFTVFADPWGITRALTGGPESEKGLDPRIER